MEEEAAWQNRRQIFFEGPLLCARLMTRGKFLFGRVLGLEGREGMEEGTHFPFWFWRYLALCFFNFFTCQKRRE